MRQDGQCYTVPALAKRWRCRPSTIRRYLRTGALLGFTLPGVRGVRVSPESVRLFESNKARSLIAQPEPKRRRSTPGKQEWY